MGEIQGNNSVAAQAEKSNVSAAWAQTEK